MKYLIFDKLESNNIFKQPNLVGIGFCVFDSLEFIDMIKSYLKDSKIGSDTTHANKDYVHYVDDHRNQRYQFTKFIQNIAFKVYTTYWLGTKGWDMSIYKSSKVCDLLKNYLLKIKRIQIEPITLIFEEWKVSDYQNLIELCNSMWIKTEYKIHSKIDSYSWITDYTLGIIKDYIEDTKINKNKSYTNPSWPEQSIKLVYDKISLCDIDIYYRERICASKDEFEEWLRKISRACIS